MRLNDHEGTHYVRPICVNQDFANYRIRDLEEGGSAVRGAKYVRRGTR